MSKYIKQLEMAELKKTFMGVRDMVVLSSTKVDTSADYTVRSTLRKKNIRFQMVKNTLVRKVFSELGINLDEKYLRGTTVLAWGTDSIKELSKTIETLLLDLGKKDPEFKNKLTIKGAVADGVSIDFELAKTMPTRLEAIGEIVGMILGPASALAGCLSGPAGQVASQIASIGDKKDESAPAA